MYYIILVYIHIILSFSFFFDFYIIRILSIQNATMLTRSNNVISEKMFLKLSQVNPKNSPKC